jgi:hypothetical protein
LIFVSFPYAFIHACTITKHVLYYRWPNCLRINDCCTQFFVMKVFFLLNENVNLYVAHAKWTLSGFKLSLLRLFRVLFLLYRLLKTSSRCGLIMMINFH